MRMVALAHHWLPGGRDSACVRLCVLSRRRGRPWAPTAHADIALGASYQALAAALDFRDIHAAVAEQGARKAGSPTWGGAATAACAATIPTPT